MGGAKVKKTVVTIYYEEVGDPAKIRVNKKTLAAAEKWKLPR